jgi:hypothetical protein
MKSLFMAALLAVLLSPLPGQAGEADVEKVQIARMDDGRYRVDVTVRHGDTGWKHYADRWEVVAPDGTVLGRRTLFHPHENEQPFTRSLSRIIIPRSVKRVTLRAHDKIHEFGGREITVAVPQKR